MKVELYSISKSPHELRFFPGCVSLIETEPMTIVKVCVSSPRIQFLRWPRAAVTQTNLYS